MLCIVKALLILAKHNHRARSYQGLYGKTLLRAPNLNLRPMGAAWFRFPWSAAHITATSAWPPKSYST
jgi:hypothetical protein